MKLSFFIFTSSVAVSMSPAFAVSHRNFRESGGHMMGGGEGSDGGTMMEQDRDESGGMGQGGGMGDAGGMGQGGGMDDSGCAGGMGHGGGGMSQPEHVSIECDASYECDLRYGGDVGTFVCRSWTHPILGETETRALCVPTDMAWTTDVCGCCLDDAGTELTCPIRPVFTSLECDDSTQPVLPGDSTSSVAQAQHMGDGADSGEMMQGRNHQFICRNLANPFTGVEQETTLFVPPDHSVEGDTCGCCTSTGCPEMGEDGRPSADSIFTRPDFVEKSCASDAANLIPCDLHPARAQDGTGDEQPTTATATTEGFFVCREFYDPRGLGESRQEAVCISEDRAWETDECGCCGTDCPERPRAVEIDCSVETTGEDNSCELTSGEAGVFVCRTVFHPFDGQARERGFCIPPNMGWVTDACGCCEAGCPTTPQNGFDTEATQLEALAMEVPEDYGMMDNSGASMHNKAPSVGLLGLALIVGSVLV